MNFREHKEYKLLSDTRCCVGNDVNGIIVIIIIKQTIETEESN